MKLKTMFAAGVSALLILTAPVLASAAKVSDFGDVSPSAWYYSAVEYAAENGLFSGTSGTTFSPELGMTRGMFVTVLGRLVASGDRPAPTEPAGETRKAGADNAKPAVTSFTDVKPSDYFAPYVEWAKENGIVSGTSQTTFSPDQKITREQMATMLYRYAEKAGCDLALEPNALAAFPDKSQISGYAQDAMTWAVSHRIISGTGTGLVPQGTATRAQVAQVFYNAENVLIGMMSPAPAIELTPEQKIWLTADQDPQEVLRHVLAGTKAAWNPDLNADNAFSVSCLMFFGDTTDGMYTTEHAVYNALETLNNTGADSFKLEAGLWEGEPSRKLKLYFTIPDKTDSPLMKEIRRLVEQHFPDARFEKMGGAHGWRGYERSDEADWIAGIEIRYLAEWYQPSDSFTYWISEPEPGKFYFFY